MESAFTNPNQPPLMSAEAQEHATPFGADPKRNQVAMAMLGKQLGTMGQMFAPQPMTRQGGSPLDVYGNSGGPMPTMAPGPISAPMAPQPDAQPSPMKSFRPMDQGPMYYF